MFTIDIVLGVLKKVFVSIFSFLWEYKGWILLGECIGRKQFYAEESAKLNNSVITLQEWGEAVIKQSKGEKDE